MILSFLIEKTFKKTILLYLYLEIGFTGMY